MDECGQTSAGVLLTNVGSELPHRSDQYLGEPQLFFSEGKVCRTRGLKKSTEPRWFEAVSQGLGAFRVVVRNSILVYLANTKGYSLQWASSLAMDEVGTHQSGEALFPQL